MILRSGFSLAETTFDQNRHEATVSGWVDKEVPAVGGTCKHEALGNGRLLHLRAELSTETDTRFLSSSQYLRLE